MHRRQVFAVAVLVVVLAATSFPFSLSAGASTLDRGDGESVLAVETAVDSDDVDHYRYEWSDEFDPSGWLMIAQSNRSESLDNDVRRRVYEAIERSPGTYPVALAETTGIPRSTIRYHVRVLEKEGLIFGEKIHGKQRYFPRGSDEVELSAVLEDDVRESVLEAIGRSEPVSGSDLATVLDRAPSTVSYHLNRLADAGAVEREYDDGEVLNRLSPKARQALWQRTDGARVGE